MSDTVRTLFDGRAFWIAVAVLLAAHAVMLIVLAAQTPWTTDEPNYLAAGLAIRKHFEFEAFSTILHGPLTFYGNQLLLPGDLSAGDPALPDAKLLSRLGMIPFGVLTGLFLVLLAKDAFGRRVALGALVLHATNPIALAHGCLITADMALTAAYTATVWAAWRYLRGPTPLRLVWVGVALGASLATKYLALFLIPALGLGMITACWRGFRPGLLWSRADGASLGRRLLDLVPAGLLCGLVALLTLHTCYLWRTGGYELRPPKYEIGTVDPQDPDAGPLSRSMRSLADVPGAATALSLLPAPFVRGVDYQKFYSERGGISYFAGELGPGFWGYFVTALAVKLPIAFVLMLIAGLAVRAPPWPRFFPGLLGWMIAIPLVYLSGFTVLQIGVRYVLPILPLLAIIAARPVDLLSSSRRGRVALGVGLAWLMLALAADWPRLIGSFNALGGNRPYLLFKDSNFDWRHVGWAPDRDGEEIARRHPQSQVVFATSGPRLGLLRIHGVELCPADPRDPPGERRRVHSWLRRFEPIDGLGPWYVFDITEADFRRAIGADTTRPDALGTTELAAALVGAGRPEDGLALLGNVADPDAARVREAAERLRDGRDQGREWAQVLLDLGRSDLVLEMDSLPAVTLAVARLNRADFAAARALLEAEEAAGRLDFTGAMLMASALRSERRPDDALAVMKRYLPPPEAAALHAQIVRALEEEIRALQLVVRKGH